VPQSLNSKPKRFAAVVSLLGLAALVWSVYNLFQEPFRVDWMLMLILMVLAASRAEIFIPVSRSKITLTDTFIYVCIVILGPWAAIVLGSLDGLARSHKVAKRVLTLGTNMAAMNLAVLAAALPARAIFGPLDGLTRNNSRIGELILCLGFVGLVIYLVNTGIVAAGHAINKNKKVVRTWVDNYLWTAPEFFIGLVAAGFICKGIAQFGFYAFVISIPILTFTYFTYKTYLGRVEASNEHIERLSKLYLATIESLTLAIDAKDQMAQGHILRVRSLAEKLARAVNYSEEQLEGLKAAALLHDIGKLAVPEHILNKPEKLSSAEFSKIMVHPVVGADILSNVDFPYEVVPIVKHHHERYDGSGYPSGLKRDEIPLGARIITIVDCYDALTHSRPQRPGFKPAQAIELMRRESGQTFDPALLQKFFEILPLIEGEEALSAVADSRHSESLRYMDIESAGPFDLTDRRAGALSIPKKSPAEQALRNITAAQKEVLSLYEISRTLGSALSLSEVLAIVAAKLEHIADFSTLVIYLADAGSMNAAYVTGRNADRIKGINLKAGEGHAGWVAEHRRILITSTPQEDFASILGTSASIYRSAAVFPLLRDESLVGALALYSEDDLGYSADEVRLLETISSHAATAVYNAQAFERSQESALTDNLTGLPNSRYMYSFFEQERSRAERDGSPLVLMMMDLDGFKKVNDTYGHHVGDEILRRTSQLIRRKLRRGDTLIRYAGDEFVAVLYHATRDAVDDLKQRLQSAVDGFAHEVRPGRVARVGISIGFARFGPDGFDISELMEIADQDMYQDKLSRKGVAPAARVAAGPAHESQ
jgi:diguanylate cyclase (GGDEF)-like protein/putative nucleotidyltransferase with HDIG domain